MLRTIDYPCRQCTHFDGSAGIEQAATDFDSLMGHWSSAGPTYYATARMHWAPERTDPAHILSEYYSGFGAASSAVEDYVEYWTDWTSSTFTSNITRTRIENLTRAISKQAGTSHGWYKNIAFVYLGSVFDQADALLEAARQACSSNTQNTSPAGASCVQRVEFLSNGCKHGRLVAEAINATNQAGEDIPGRGLNRTGIAMVMKAAAELSAFREQVAPSGAVNVMW
jgi:hypothetical protein|eukprot:COSAG06_NODE_1546_length_9134_cov_2.183951_11_plen_226_part_00